MANRPRPLSPHLQVYRLPFTGAVLSITNRATGVALTIGMVLMVWWLVALATDARAYAAVEAFVGSWIGIVFLLGWTWALFLHLGNGIRHLVWDAGHAFDLASVDRGGWIVVIASIVLTAAVWGTAFAYGVI